MKLTDEDREALGDWWDDGETFEGDWNVATLIPFVEAIVARHVAAALNAAADEIEEVAWVKCPGCDSCDGNSHHALITAARIVRTAARAAP